MVPTVRTDSASPFDLENEWNHEQKVLSRYLPRARDTLEWREKRRWGGARKRERIPAEVVVEEEVGLDRCKGLVHLACRRAHQPEPRTLPHERGALVGGGGAVGDLGVVARNVKQYLHATAAIIGGHLPAALPHLRHVASVADIEELDVRVVVGPGGECSGEGGAQQLAVDKKR